MIIRISRASSGFSEYMEKGLKQESSYSRDEKDKRIILYGNLQTFKKTEQYLNEHKNYKDNYLHITISYSKEDIKRMDKLSDNEKLKLKQDLVNEVIKHHTSGYDLDNEVIAYGETHQPIIKFENDKERYEHEHIGIALYNPLNDTKLRTTYATNDYMDNVLQAYLNKKYNFTQPLDVERKVKKDITKSKIGKTRTYYLKELKDIKDRKELLQYFKVNKINYKEVKTKNNEYYKIISNDKNIKDINLKGKGFTHLENIKKDINYVNNRDKNIDELKNILSSYYANRIKMIDNRRSVTSKQALNDIYKDKYNNKIDDNEYSLKYLSYQEKIFYKHYNHLLVNNVNLKGYFIKTDDNNQTAKFVNKERNINVEDKGDKIVSIVNDNDNIKERVSLMINIAIAKNWNLNQLNIKGSESFRKEVEKQIAQQLKIKQTKDINNNISLKRADTLATTFKNISNETKELKQANEELKNLKETLNANLVLNYAIDKYKLNPNEYQITNDNKIKNLTNNQKPKNVIDFMQKEVNLTSKQAIEIIKDIDKNKIVLEANLKVKQTVIIDDKKEEKQTKKHSLKL